MYVDDTVIGINVGSGYARCAYTGKNTVPVMVPNRWGNISTPSGDTMAPLFRALREDAEIFLERLVSSCALAVPESFSPLRREVMVKAAEETGMTNVTVLTEPVAAAIAAGGDGRLLILDCGAGRSDLSVAEKEAGTWIILERAELADVSGNVFDLSLAEWFRERLGLGGLPQGDPRRSALAREAETVKIALSSSLACDWQPPPLNGRTFSPVRVDREELERMIRFSIRRLLNTASRLWDKYRPERLLLTGGTSRVPLLRDTLSRGIARPDHLGLGPEEAAAAGAAIYASGEHRQPRGTTGEQLEERRRVRELKMHLVRMEPSLSASRQKRLCLVLDKMENLASDAASIEALENIVKDLEKELFSSGPKV